MTATSTGDFDLRFDDPEFDRAWIWAVTLYSSDGANCTLPDLDNEHDLQQFMQGIGFSIAEHDFAENYDSIESVLARFSAISPELRAGLLCAAAKMLDSSSECEWFRWPNIKLYERDPD